MKTKKRLFRLFAVIALTWCFVAFPTTPRADRATPEILNYLPKDILVYAETLNLRESIARGEHLSLVNFLSHPEIQDFMYEILKSRKKDATDDLDNFKTFVQLMQPVWEFLDYGFTGRTHLCIPDKTDEAGRGQLIFAGEIREGRMAYVKDFMKVLPDIARELSKHLGAKKVLVFHVAEIEIDGHPVTMLRREYDAPENESLCYTVLGNYAVLTIGRDSMTETVNRFQGVPAPTLAENEDVSRCMQNVDWRELFWYFNSKRMFERAQQLFEETGVEMPVALKGLALMGLDTAAGGTSFVGNQVQDDIVSCFDLEKQMSLDFMQGTRCRFAAAELMPQEAFFYYTFPFPLKKIYASMLEEDREALKPLLKVEEELDLSIQETILPLFSNELEFYFTFQGFLPETMWSMRIKDDPENVELLLSLLSKKYPDKFGVSTFEGYDIYMFKGKDLATFALAQAFTVHENKLLWGSIPAIQNAILGMEENLANDEAFMRAKGLVTDKTNGFIFIDMQKMLVVVKQFLLPNAHQLPCWLEFRHDQDSFR
ncbi:MAG: hypothetical protein U5N86_09980 [Planctomycetota bacterium]|nr:hypothetical protein [Planctomycetota bacterium]